MTGTRGPTVTVNGWQRSSWTGRRRRPRCWTLVARSTRSLTVATSWSGRSSRSCPPARGRLRCLRGVDTLTAVGLCAEIGDFERFAKAEQLMSYIGLVPSEATTGQQRRLGSITKTGSGHARRLLTEAAWHYRPRPNLGKTLRERQHGQPPAAVAVSWKAQLRLHRTWARLEARAKRRTLIAVAAARELAGFCWAITQIE
jgi:transposase